MLKLEERGGRGERRVKGPTEGGHLTGIMWNRSGEVAGCGWQLSLSPSSAVKDNIHPVVPPQGASNVHVEPTLEASHPCFVIPADSIREESSSSTSKRFVFLWFAALGMLFLHHRSPWESLTPASNQISGDPSDRGYCFIAPLSVALVVVDVSFAPTYAGIGVMDVCNAAPLCARNKDGCYWFVMFRSAPFRPLCPSQNRGVICRASDSTPQTTQNDDNLCVQYPGFSSDVALLDEQPLLLDDLFTDPEISTGWVSLRRSASDPLAFLEVASSLHGLSPVKEEDAVSDGVLHESLESEGTSEVGTGFEAGNCVYGPNSPRQRSKLTDSESWMVSSLLENVPSNPLQYLTMNYPSTYVVNEPNGKEVDCIPSGNLDSEKISRRRSGQRSGVRKLQYIVELERTVDMLQTVGTDLAARVTSLFQYRLALSVENKNLRQQIACFRQEKVIKDGEHQSLKKEAERLKMMLRHHRRSKSMASCFEKGTYVADPSTLNWQTLDLDKLTLGGSQVPLKHSPRHR
ncbi:hypothetical protein MUK42_14470 [Musa troglodytarum]|uniref:Uncharacterized protein n=1 Tax=Musa troglodytarum TaxID=320322 RepID=A0A9E7L9R0_9LILI|nr:hypothetical protein MUK42_14470 [Musa troglodytarum]